MDDIAGDEFREFGEKVNAGVPVPVVDPEQLKRLWRGIRDVLASLPQDKATGLGAIAGAAFMSGKPTATEYLSTSMRANLISALLERGVLCAFQQGNDLAEIVFRAAATIPMTLEDLGEATLQLHLRTMPSEEAAKVKAQLLAEGYDFDQPTIDGKFLAAVRDAERRT